VVRGADAVLVNDFAGTVVTPARSAAVMLSSGVYGDACAAVARSEFKASSTFLSLPPQAKARNAAGSIASFLNILKPPEMTPALRDGDLMEGSLHANKRM
jgi:hypothetical protein